jgi:hypothetical protein
MEEQSLGIRPVESRRGAEAFSHLSSVHLGFVEIAVCCLCATILKWAGRGGVACILKEPRPTAPDERTTTSRVSPTAEKKGSHDGGCARGELLRGIGFYSYEPRRAVAACGELRQALAGRFDLAKSRLFCCMRSADGIDPPSKVRNLTNRLSRRLRCVFNSR